MREKEERSRRKPSPDAKDALSEGCRGGRGTGGAWGGGCGTGEADHRLALDTFHHLRLVPPVPSATTTTAAAEGAGEGGAAVMG